MKAIACIQPHYCDLFLSGCLLSCRKGKCLYYHLANNAYAVLYASGVLYKRGSLSPHASGGERTVSVSVRGSSCFVILFSAQFSTGFRGQIIFPGNNPFARFFFQFQPGFFGNTSAFFAGHFVFRQSSGFGALGNLTG